MLRGRHAGLSSLKSPALTSTLYLTAPSGRPRACILGCRASNRAQKKGSCLLGGAPPSTFQGRGKESSSRLPGLGPLLPVTAADLSQESSVRLRLR